MNTNIAYRIHGGPSRDRLLDALKYAYDDDARVDLDFGIAAGYTGNPNKENVAFVKLPAKNFRVVQLSHEDGSGQSFNFSGYCVAGEQGSTLTPYGFKAYYNAKHREGWIQFVEDLTVL